MRGVLMLEDRQGLTKGQLTERRAEGLPPMRETVELVKASASGGKEHCVTGPCLGVGTSQSVQRISRKLVRYFPAAEKP